MVRRATKITSNGISAKKFLDKYVETDNQNMVGTNTLGDNKIPIRSFRIRAKPALFTL